MERKRGMNPSDEVKVAVVTGSSRGIGLEITKRFLRQGMVVYGIARGASDELERLLKEYPVQLRFKCADVNDDTWYGVLAREIWSEHKQLNVLINNAGMPSGGLLGLVRKEEFEKVMKTNFISPVFLIKALSRYMAKSTKPIVINIGSASSFRYDPGTLAYSSAKVALSYATKQLSFELKSMGIRVNCVAPGVTKTKMLDGMSESAVSAQINAGTTGRETLAMEVAALVEYLMSESASQINGQTIRIDGGQP